MSEPYDFEFPTTPPAVCNRCGALVQNRTVHDEWHEALLTRNVLADALDGVAARSRSRYLAAWNE